MTKSRDKELQDTKRLMGALVRMEPRPHEDMKVGRSKKKRRVEGKKKNDY